MQSDPATYDFTNVDAEAERRAHDWRDQDPFEQIPRALLSQDHIKDYVRVTGMLCPFFPDNPKRLKAASYEAWPKRFIRWNEDGQKIIDDLSKEEYEKNGYELKENSITFVQIDTTIRLPNYIALRFNLSITHVHRGLLLGTGPLVDPGFSGELLIPLHNLTSAPYRLRNGIIWFEFTKTSSTYDPPDDFKKRKRNIDSETYFERASQNNPIQSSIPVAVRNAQKSASEAKADAHKAVKTNRFFASIGFLAILGMILAAVGFGISVLRDASSATAETKALHVETDNLRTDLNAARHQIEELRLQAGELRAQLDRLRNQQPSTHP